MIIPITNAPALRSLTLQTPAPGFLKPITVEALADGGSARPIASRITFFRQRGVDRLSLDLPTLDASVRSLRITLDDSRSAPIPISAVVLEEEEIPTPSWMILPLQAGDRLEGSGQSRINLQIGAAGIPIERMRFTTDEPVFARRIELMSREWGAQGLEDRPLASGSIHRLTFDAETRSESLEFTARFKAPAPEIVMVIENGDSPAMTFQRIEALWHPVRLLFHSRSAGTFLLLSGNPQARSPRYDLGLLLGDARRATLQAVQPRPLTVRASFRPPSGLPQVPLFGGPLDATQWDFRRHLSLLGDGVHRLKLPLHTLAKARPDLSDVRLISGGRQLLYLIDRPLLQMPVALVAASAPVPKQPTLSRWKLELPMDGLAPTRIRCISVASLFDPSLRIYEEVQNPSGGKSPRILGQARWIRTPENPRSLLEIGLPG
ncbi:MAG: DUF3999 domain-containing protein, partial [Verrucomicrobia bacterium]|nr:DUF3999 domain-containing protein [Verrucomicrobiota bacterium]